MLAIFVYLKCKLYSYAIPVVFYFIQQVTEYLACDRYYSGLVIF